ncbi:fibrobacter succinogenes major paralogous domain-containing protein [uncultured Fibrobacter sp.]|uniref:fibrobacter succinogenes major paralogous domain-containing protein n=1 Tax=uncultured Fibrobacter sp. TaxID=261512 RepID=UPI0025EFB441|nr:fibrobacter succinogenes major paralogous domain-containing protein [uncultured Fibrobacter sp.]
MFTKKDLNMKKWILPTLMLGSILVTACSDGRQTTGTSEESEGITAVKDWEVAGVSQKGPFVTGSSVTVQELDGITLKQTGKSFKGTIKSDKGDFAIKDINLQSQYAILEASGYYRDEITGKKSTGTVTLRALTDLTKRKTVNINLLTHLEYERVMYLVTEKKMSIAKAKAQADEEILAAFGIDVDFGKSEDLNIFESGDGNAALLAISVLMHADADVAGLTERMGEFSIAIAEGGDWEDADTKAVIADWACDADLKGSLANVRDNVEGWKYADSVPAFEKYVTNFWWDNYGLGQCTSKREGDTKRNVNKLSKMYNEYFVCESGRWHIPGEEPASSSSGNEPGSSSVDSGEPVFGELTDARDGRVYKTVKLGSQEWMAENLNYAAEGSLCYEDDEKNCEKYGRLYNWEIALDTSNRGCGDNFSGCRLRSDFHPREGICPDGWHVPEHAEWDTLFAYADAHGEGESAGDALQAYYRDDYLEKTYSSDRFGFNVVPAGVFNGKEFSGLGTSSEFWTASIETTDWLSYISITPSTIHFVKGSGSNVYMTHISHAVSVRCVKGQGGKRNGYDFDAPRYEEDLPEEVGFIQDYVSDKDRRAWDDDSLMTFWYVRHITGSESVHTSGKNYSQYVSVSLEDDARDSLDQFKGVLVENGFAYVKSDSIGQATYNGRDGIYFMHEVATSDSKVRRDYYEKETAKARYVIVILVGANVSAGESATVFRYGYSIEVHTYYKPKS